MNKKRKQARTLALLMLAIGLASPPTAVAQNYGDGGLLGRGDTRSEGSAGVLNQGFGGTQGGFLNQGFGGTSGGLGNQGFGSETHGGITNQGFQVPLGSGLLVLAAAGAGYATIKKRNKKQNKQNKQNKH